MKKLHLVLACALALSANAFCFDINSINLQGSIGSLTQTDYTVSTKFGDYFRTPSEKTVYIYNSQGLLTEKGLYTAKDVLIEKTSYSYNISMYLTQEVTSDANGTPTEKTTYEYTTDGQLSSISTYNGSGELTCKVIYKYTAAPNAQVTESVYNGEGALTSRCIIKLNGQGIPEEEAFYFADGTLDERRKYTYQDDGLCSKAEVYDAEGKIKATEEYKYTGKALTEIQLLNENGVLFERTLIKTDSKGNPTSVNVYSVAEKFGSIVNELQSISAFSYKYN